MKSLHLIGLAVAALSCASFAGAQEAADAGAKLRAYVALPSQKPQELIINRSDGNDKFYYTQKGTDQELEVPVASCKALFFIQTPAELANALNTYREGDLSAARKQFAAVKNKYANFGGLPGSPLTVAAVNEISCCVRQMDWDGVKKLTANPPTGMTTSDEARVAVARLMADIITAPGPGKTDDQKKAIAQLLKDKKLGKSINTELYGWLRYALARAYAAQLPTDATAIPEDKLKDAEAAIDNYCQCVVSTHGAADELPVDSMVRAMSLLWGMPGVAEYTKKADAPLTAAKWASAPANFRDAVAMANLLKTVYAPELQNELVEKLVPYFYNTAKDKEKKADTAKEAK